MTQDLSIIDRKILNALQKNAALSMDALSEQVNLSRNACWRRVKQMEADGTIKGRVALINPDALDLGLSVFVLIKTNEHAQDWLERFEKTVKDMPEIVGAHRMSGELDYVLRVRVSNMKDYDRFYQQLIGRITISDISASFVMDDIKDTTALPTGV